MRWFPALVICSFFLTTGARAGESGQPVSISFWDERRGLLVSRTFGPADGASTVHVTRDGGRTWRVVTRPFAGPAEVSAVAGTDVAFAATANGVLRTSDGGASWALVSPRTVERPSFATRWHGWAVERSRIVSTHDGGRHWRTLRGPCVKETFVEVSLASRTRGWVVCSLQPGAGQQPKEVWSTRDGGRRWQLVNRAPWSGKRVGRGLCTCGYPRGIAMRPDGAGWLWMARGSFYATRDGGRSWTSLPISSPEIVEGRSASLLSGRIGYALFGHRPALRFTRDDGLTWTVVRRWSQ